MTRIYTDHAGLLPWTFGLLAVISFWSAYEAFSGGRGVLWLDGQVGGMIYVFGVGFWSLMLARRLRQIRQAKREGRDPAIIKIVQRGR